ncbi:hypothetical protein D3C76_1389040 [compost metagenome]
MNGFDDVLFGSSFANFLLGFHLFDVFLSFISFGLVVSSFFLSSFKVLVFLLQNIFNYGTMLRSQFFHNFFKVHG